MGYAANLADWALFHESQWRWAKTCGTVNLLRRVSYTA
jgi:hypothetical protein